MKITKRKMCVAAAMLLALMLPIVAMAADAGEQTLTLGCGFGVDESAMSAEQKVTREAAVNQYYAAEDEVLTGLVESGAAAQADADAYIAGRNARWLLALMDKSAWTAEQTQAYEAAAALSSSERDTSADALVTSGQLTNEQGEALKASDTIANRSIALTDAKAVETATSSLEALRQTLRQTLTDAGITITTNGSGGGRNQDTRYNDYKGGKL